MNAIPKNVIREIIKENDFKNPGVMENKKVFEIIQAGLAIDHWTEDQKRIAYDCGRSSREANTISIDKKKEIRKL